MSQEKEERIKSWFIAVNAGNEATIKQMLSEDPSLIDARTDTLNCVALHDAASHGHIGIMTILLDSNPGNINKVDNLFCTALHLAAGHGQKRAVQCLLQRGANINQQDKRGRTALHCAIRGSHMETIKILLDSTKVNVKKTDDDGNTVLHYAARLGAIAAIEYLLKTGDNINKKNKKGYAALHCAAMNGNIQVVKSLIESKFKPDIDLTDKKGQTALHHAAIKGHTGAVEYLLMQGAKIEIKDRYGKTALSYLGNFKEKITKSIGEKKTTWQAIQSRSILNTLKYAVFFPVVALITAALWVKSQFNNEKSIIDLDLSNDRNGFINATKVKIAIEQRKTFGLLYEQTCGRLVSSLKPNSDEIKKRLTRQIKTANQDSGIEIKIESLSQSHTYS